MDATAAILSDTLTAAHAYRDKQYSKARALFKKKRNTNEIHQRTVYGDFFLVFFRRVAPTHTNTIIPLELPVQHVHFLISLLPI
jgi:hypothetical protein